MAGRSGIRPSPALEMAELLTPPQESRPPGVGITLLRQLLLDVAIDRLCNRAPPRFDIAEVPTLDHRGLDGRSPSLSKSTCWKAGGTRRVSRLAHLDMKCRLPS